MSGSLDRAGGAGVSFLEGELPNLLELTPDPLFRDDGAKPKLTPGNFSPATAALNKLDLDIKRISNRLLVMGRCWQHRTDKSSHRNNIDELALLLNAKYGKNYLIWSLCSPDIKYDTAPFRNQLVNFSSSRAVSLSLKNLFDICRSLLAWLMLDDEHVAIVQCKNGLGRSGLAIACFLRYCERFDSTYESFDFFLQKRSPLTSAWVTVTTRRYLRYFNDILILHGRVPNSLPLTLHQVIMNTVPNFDGEGGCNPGIEVYQNGKLLYSSKVRQAEVDARAKIGDDRPPQKIDDDESPYDLEDNGELVRELRMSLEAMNNLSIQEYDPLVLNDSNHVAFRLENLVLDRDVQLRIYHHNEQSGQNITILNLVFNTGFVAPGVIRLRSSDLELPFAALSPPSSSTSSVASTCRFDPNFSMDIIVTPATAAAERPTISYQSQTVHSRANNLLKLSQFHTVRPDPLLIKPLELQGHRKFLARLALQLRNNDIHSAHELLTQLVKKSFSSQIDAELLQLGKSKYEKMKATNQELIEEAFSLPSTPLEGTSRRIEEPIVEAQIVEFAAEASPGKTEHDNPVMSKPSDLNHTNEEKQDEAADLNPMLAELQRRGRKTREEMSVNTATDSKITRSMEESPVTTASTSSIPTPSRPSAPSQILARQGGPPPPPPLPTSKIGVSRVGGGPPPPPPPPPPPGKKGAPPPSNSVYSSTETMEDEHASSKPKIRSKFHWEELKDRKKLRNTVWLELMEQIPDYDPASLDIHKFEELFCVDATAEDAHSNKFALGVAAAQAKESKPIVQILDLRRVNNAGIGLSRFYKRLTHEEIISAIINREMSVLSLDDLLSLRALAPTDEEQNLLNLFTGSRDELGAAERFMALAAKEANLAWMIDCLIFERQFDGEVETSLSKLKLIIGLLTKIRESPSLKILLRSVLELGNLANYDYGAQAVHVRVRGKALGFRMESLMKLQDVKSVDRKTNLLQYLVMTLEERHPEVLNLPVDFTDLALVRHWDTSALLMHIEELVTTFKQMRDCKNKSERNSQVESFRNAQQVFMHRAATELDRLGKIAIMLKDSWHKTSEYLGEESNDRRPEELFLILDQFFKSLSNAIHTVQSEQKKRASPSKIAEGMGQMTEPVTSFRLPKAPHDHDTASISSSDISGLSRSESSLSLRSKYDLPSFNNKL